MKRLLTCSFVCLSLVLSSSAFAQSQRVLFGIGLTTIRGELSNESVFDEEYGLNYTLKYMVPLSNEQFVFTAETSFLNMKLRRQFGTGDKAVNYQSIVSHTYMGVGLRFYLSKSVNKYNPYKGQFLPFVGIGAGGVHINRISNRAVTPQQIAGKKPDEDPTAGYDFYEGSNYEFAPQVEAGFQYVLNSIWTIEGSGMVRPGFSDSWDGVKGTTNSPDYLMSGMLGLQMNF